MSDPTVVLETQGLKKSFGGVKVIDDLSIRLDEGEALGIVGPNGAGKTTLFNLITGVYRPDAGRVIFNSKDITGLHRQDRCRAGIGRTFQIPRPFGDMSVFENVLVCAAFGRNKSERASYERCVEALEMARLTDKANRQAGALPLLDRKRLELATRPRRRSRASCCSTRSPAASPRARSTMLIATIRDLRAQGLSIIWIEHIVHALLAVVDRISAISFGALLARAIPNEVMCSDEVQACYMGGTPT